MSSTLIVRFALRGKRYLWFKRTQSSIINQRGMLGQYLSLGYPVTRKGLYVTLGLILAIALECLAIIYLIPDQLS
ncbi:MAG TPA: hypothetical protein H9850_00580 [Candidatus Anaerobiospirillum pullistercoris]|uniref:Uncharacterized protein n=1 Tax=Candidatus Anaerobiospirillum pullistercoris TaxID=2838452 RepID=A0A9D1WB89_9GAMM|nr:hypothetical protein [Candidatus Anaerobiospirillum pullistercoris]